MTEQAESELLLLRLPAKERDTPQHGWPITAQDMTGREQKHRCTCTWRTLCLSLH
uniref:Uncharacterized protein n=1 Tax=Anguilla anguilla TaxID=7936 RepID=A0A0E9SJK8_ANGAN